MIESKSETKICQNCKKDFVIEPDDFSFYEKIKVPPPTFCPKCRLVRRLIWRNERSLYKRKCDMCNKQIIAMYDNNVSFPVYCPECYRSDNWEASKYGQKYDFSIFFFEQFKELFKKVPRLSLWQSSDCYEVDYANYVKLCKNVYLSFSILSGSENISFSSNIDNSKEIFDSYNITNSELIYEGIDGDKNYNSQYSYWSSNCINCNFILDCNNCNNCFKCVNLQNKKYCILNKQCSKEEYENKIKEFDMGSYKFIEKTFKEFWGFSFKHPRKYTRIINCINSTGNNLRNCKNTKLSFSCYGTDNVKYCYRSVGIKDSIDVCHSWAELVYEHALAGSENSKNLKFIINGGSACHNLEYCDFCKSSSYLLGCIGLRNKKYCILNKQYTKEEYEELISKIKQHMNDMPYVDSKGNIYKYGEFFPSELSPFGYNETVINDHFSLTKKEIIEHGYSYKEKIENKYVITLKAKDIPDNIKDVDNSILNEVIECFISNKAFKITPFELQFYRKMNIPIPKLHPDERYKERLAQRNPMKLWHRTCMKEGCNNEFETSYSPDRPEIVYCEKCYQKEVY